MRIITWNIRQAQASSEVWDIFKKLNPDVALLQEVGSIPDSVTEDYSVKMRNAVKKNGEKQSFSTAALVKGEILGGLSLSSQHEWVNEKLEHYQGNIIDCEVKLDKDRKLNVVSVYSPAWRVDLAGLEQDDIDLIKLKDNPDVWMTEILWSALKNTSLLKGQWVVGGDFNSSETFDARWQEDHGVENGMRSGGNREIIDRMYNLGFKECVRGDNERTVPTFQNASDHKVLHQMDHLYVTHNLYIGLEKIEVEDQLSVFEKNISDHLPIVADFTFKQR